MISSRKTKPSLNIRISLCQDIAEVVLQVHSVGLVHKNIRPDNVLLFDFVSSQPSAGDHSPSLYLSGWQYARHVSGETTQMIGEANWQKAIYHHPERQRQAAEAQYSIRHDIYSLGVCMLEMLSWESLVVHQSLEGPKLSERYKTIFNTFMDHPGDFVKPFVTSDDSYFTRDPQNVQKVLIEMAKTAIPPAAGQKMADLVEQCLTCSDAEDDLEQSMVFPNQDRRSISQHFVDTILRDIRTVLSII